MDGAIHRVDTVLPLPGVLIPHQLLQPLGLQLGGELRLGGLFRLQVSEEGDLLGLSLAEAGGQVPEGVLLRVHQGLEGPRPVPHLVRQNGGSETSTSPGSGSRRSGEHPVLGVEPWLRFVGAGGPSFVSQQGARLSSGRNGRHVGGVSDQGKVGIAGDVAVAALAVVGSLLAVQDVFQAFRLERQMRTRSETLRWRRIDGDG